VRPVCADELSITTSNRNLPSQSHSRDLRLWLFEEHSSCLPPIRWVIDIGSGSIFTCLARTSSMIEL
jgi:hypothetical protein